MHRLFRHQRNYFDAIGKLICASNINNVLTDFFTTGVYDINREFHKTSSPSMDILISSNLERLLFEISGRDDAFVADVMNDLVTDGEYEIDFQKLRKTVPFIVGGYSAEEDTLDAIANFYDVNDYLLDPHTAVAVSVFANYAVQTSDQKKTVIVSTASPYKFPTDVYYALTTNDMSDDSVAACKKLENYTGVDMPEPLVGLANRKARFTDCVAKQDIKETVLNYIKKK